MTWLRKARRDDPQPERVSGTRGHPRSHSHIAACRRCADETRPPSMPPMTSLPPAAPSGKEDE